MKAMNLMLGLVTTVFLFSNAMAENQDIDFNKEKNLEISRTKERIKIGEERINCLQSSKDFEGIKSCNQNADRKVDALEARSKSQTHGKDDSHENKKNEKKHTPDNTKH